MRDSKIKSTRIVIEDWDDVKSFKVMFQSVIQDASKVVTAVNAVKLHRLEVLFNRCYTLTEKLRLEKDENLLDVYNIIVITFTEKDIEKSFDILSEMFAELKAIKSASQPTISTKVVVGTRGSDDVIVLIEQSMKGEIIHLEISAI